MSDRTWEIINFILLDKVNLFIWIYSQMMLKKNKVVYLPFLINYLLNGIPQNHYGKVGMGIRGSNRVSVLSIRILVFRVYQNQSHSDYIKVRFGIGSGSIGFGSGLVNLQRTGITYNTFRFGSQSVLRFKNTWFIPIL